MKNKLTKIGIVAIIFLLIANFGFLIIINKKTNCDRPLFLEVHIVYEEGKNYRECAKVLDYNTVNASGVMFATTLDAIYVKFYNLDVNETYILCKAGAFDHEFTNTTEITICMFVVDRNRCYLDGYQDDIVWVCIGEWDV